jgi:histidine triad (HIT) family protein
MDCIFCKIAQGTIPSPKVYEDQDLFAIKDISPQAPIHYLFIPKAHLKSLEEVPVGSPLMSQIYEAIRKTAQKEGFAEKGYRTVINTNGHGCQSVFHLHVHCLGGRQLGGNMVGLKSSP